MKAFLAAAMLLCGSAHAAEPSPLTMKIPPITDEQLHAGLEMGQEIEARVDGDLNGDGDPDTVYVVASPDERTVNVVLSVRSEFEAGQTLGGTFKLQPDRLGGAALSIKKGVLVIEDLTGGTTALSTTYRYRIAKGQPRMQLIGMDVTLYSRTWAHDGDEMSWNVLTGDTVTSLLKVRGSGEDASYETLYTRKFKRPARTIYMDDTPEPEFELISVTKAK
ncbi:MULTISPECIES: hypothetical protein [unclassified Sphingopyxis]|uniref:hypothetical protein n=1 Tax=unclassified Sphingopyxis TaxID=2614943 RepID=UPI000735F0E6|nr:MULTISPECIES: hypothetical protein [unclassified Sphingopyxis]KTE25339.1 hypothetical protein ATE62_22305 [Sphingopyxis sp. HIX]KTE81066.1 hypothetical protein ATE72_17045 [Sphingopyxis sp. HXXIV]